MNHFSDKTLRLVQTALLAALVLLLAFTPSLGYIPIGVISVTIVHVPVIIGSILLGPGCGALLGFLFGLSSMIMATTNAGVTSFIFSPFYSAGITTLGPLYSLIISFIPRILVGVVPSLVYRGLKKLFASKKGMDAAALLIAGVCGSMTNTILVMGLTYLLFGQAYAEAIGIAYEALVAAILSIVFINGLIEAAIAAVLTGILVKALRQVSRRMS